MAEENVGATFGLEIMAARNNVYQGRAKQLIFTASDGGKVGILAKHQDFIGALGIGELEYETPDGEWHYYASSSGTISMANNRVLILTMTAEKPEEIDRRRAEDARDRALEAMRQKQSILEYRRTQASLARALSRLRVSEEHHFI
jgi:F-type H+-transporting ATPase subunit epsilon